MLCLPSRSLSPHPHPLSVPYRPHRISPRVLTTATCHVMSSATDLESGQGAQAAPITGAFCSLSHHCSLQEVLMNHKEGVGGSDSALPIHEAQPIVSQAENLDETSSSACCCIPSRVFRPFTSTRGGGNIDHSQRNVSDQSAQTQTGQSSSRPPPEAQTRTYFFTISETSLI